MAGEADIGGAVGTGVGSFFGPIGAAIGGGIGKGLGSAVGGGDAPLMSSASSAAYGTTLGNDGWVINFGSGAQWASPVSTSSASYPPPDTQPNVLTGLGPQQQAGYGGGTLAMVTIAGLLAYKFFKRG